MWFKAALRGRVPARPSRTAQAPSLPPRPPARSCASPLDAPRPGAGAEPVSVLLEWLRGLHARPSVSSLCPRMAPCPHSGRESWLCVSPPRPGGAGAAQHSPARAPGFGPPQSSPATRLPIPVLQQPGPAASRPPLRSLRWRRGRPRSGTLRVVLSPNPFPWPYLPERVYIPSIPLQSQLLVGSRHLRSISECRVGGEMREKRAQEREPGRQRVGRVSKGKIEDEKWEVLCSWKNSNSGREEPGQEAVGSAERWRRGPCPVAAAGGSRRVNAIFIRFLASTLLSLLNLLCEVQIRVLNAFPIFITY